ncbi:hypothetical protein HMN09_00240100 [Mycena chlorophos]|uniref:DUF6534 domain-containing protein n=1 Tax=Mycena chlorophos TaxID=658473 RepID=A0A8H6TL09_MYCCL|nr:hypothetical protein HMN09_00240100 [Mycena chlorophos]
MSMTQPDVFTAPILAGTQANWLLLGTLMVQVYKFHLSFPNERRWVKALVYTLFTLEVAQTAITSHFAYEMLVTSWGDPTAFSILPWSSLAVPIFTGLISAAVQIFYAWRIYFLKGDRLWARIVCVAIVLLALMQSLSAFITDARFATTTNVATLPSLMVGVKIWLIGSAACDVLITITLLFILSEYRRKMPWKRMDGIIGKLIANTVETGLITSVVAIADVILFILFSQTNIHQTPAFMLGKLYTNVLLATLNSRVEMEGRPSAHNNNAGPGSIQTAGAGIHFVSEVQWRRYGTTNGGEIETETRLERPSERQNGVASKVQVEHIEMESGLARKDTAQSVDTKRYSVE